MRTEHQAEKGSDRLALEGLTPSRILVNQLATRAEDAELVRILDAYLADLEAGRAPDPEAIIAAHPDLADRLRACLAGLQLVEGVVPPPLVGPTTNAGDNQELGVLGDFRLLREVGRGGMGIVYEAQQISLKRRVALKVLPFAATLDAKRLQRFQNEAQAAAHLEHPHIVSVHSVGTDRGVHYYAMQFIDGQTLADIIDDLRRVARPERSEGRAEPPTPPTPFEDSGRATPDEPTQDYSPQSPAPSPEPPRRWWL